MIFILKTEIWENLKLYAIKIRIYNYETNCHVHADFCKKDEKI